MREFLEQIAPLNNADKITQAAVRRPGQERPARPAQRGRADGRHASSKNGTPVWYLMAKDEGHGFAKKKNADFQFYATVLFVRRYLLEEAAATNTKYGASNQTMGFRTIRPYRHEGHEGGPARRS